MCKISAFSPKKHTKLGRNFTYLEDPGITFFFLKKSPVVFFFKFTISIVPPETAVGGDKQIPRSFRLRNIHHGSRGKEVT